MIVTEERFRELLDPRGLLRPQALAPPDRSVAYTVFAQAGDAGLDMTAIKSHALRFFGAKVGLTVDKQYGTARPELDAARLVLATDDGTATGTRLCFGRPAESSDYEAAELAEQIRGTTGMSLLARRCRTVWLIACEADDDPAALRMAAIFASSMLGPILSPSGDELFGVRTARLKLEGRAGR